MKTHLAANPDLPAWALPLALALVAASLVLLGLELRRRRGSALVVVLTGLVAASALLAAVLRPVRIAARESAVGPRVVVLLDVSRSMALPSDGVRPRFDEALGFLQRFATKAKDARVETFTFAGGAPRPLPPQKEGERPDASRLALGATSDLGAAVRALAQAPDERPAAVVVVSDGRLDDPPEGTATATLKGFGDALRVPIQAVATTREGKPDASLRRVGTAGAAVAHVPFPLRIEVGCTGGLSCDELAVTARELRDDGPPALLASGMVHVKDGKGVLDLTATLERAGPHIVEVALAAPDGDAIPENNRRFLTFPVARERVRVLHVAGRPTHDVRTLRQWLKGNASVDTVAFFILRTQADNPLASPDELALIPFPVDELFSEYLPSFDAVVLQDFDAQPYTLDRYLPALARYVKSGGGLMMVGGPNSFVAGGYAGTPLADVLPVNLDASPGATAADPGTFTPTWTDQGRAAPLLGPLRALLGDELPPMPGTNILGDVHPGSLALWTHPTRATKTGARMPVLAIGEQGNGRSIALGLDGSWLLQFSAVGARSAGRGAAALWDGLLGWLMRDPRFEPAQLELPDGCTAGVSSRLLAHVATLAGTSPGEAELTLRRLDKRGPPVILKAPTPTPPGDTVEFALPPLEAGGYSARLRLGLGQSTQRDFACEAGGEEWADSRPDPDRLRALAAATGGTFVWASEDGARIPLPPPTVVSAERHVVPIAPPWAWTLLAALATGAHWIVRRRSGLS